MKETEYDKEKAKHKKTMTQTLLLILGAIVALYQNPKVQADPVMLAQVNSMYQAVVPLMQEMSATSTPVTPYDIKQEQIPNDGNTGNGMIGEMVTETTSTPIGTCAITANVEPGYSLLNGYGTLSYVNSLGETNPERLRINSSTPMGPMVTISWVLEGIPSSTVGELYTIKGNTVSDLGIKVQINNGNPKIEWGALSGKWGYVMKESMGPSYYSPEGYEAKFGDVNCRTYLPNIPWDGKTWTTNLVSTSDPQ